MIKREFTVSKKMEEQISEALKALGYELSNATKIADCILQLSDFFIQSGHHSTPWKEK